MLTTDKERDRLYTEMEKATERLMELGCDSVRIFITSSGKGDETHSSSAGLGNFHAQRGQVREWGICQDERTKEDVRRESEEDEDG